MLTVRRRASMAPKILKTQKTATAESSRVPAESTSTISQGQHRTFADTFKQGSVNLLKATGRGVGRVAKSIGNSILETATEFGKNTAGGALFGAVPAALAGVVFATAGPLAGLASTVALGVGSGLAHQALAPENPMDKGLSPAAKSYNRSIDSLGVGTLVLSSALFGMVNVPFAGAGVALTAATGAIGGALGSVVQQTGRALGFYSQKAA